MRPDWSAIAGKGYFPSMGVRTWVEGWPVYRQLTGTDPLGRGLAAQSPRSATLSPRTDTADSMARSVCPYCAVGCAQNKTLKRK